MPESDEILTPRALRLNIMRSLWLRKPRRKRPKPRQRPRGRRSNSCGSGSGSARASNGRWSILNFGSEFIARSSKKGNMATQMTKSQLIEKIAEDTELGKKDVKTVIESLVTVGHKELKKTGIFLVPGFAKFVVIKKPATKARKGINPFTKEPTVFKARPARKIVRARPVKAAKDAV